MTSLIDHAYLAEQTFGDIDLARELLVLFAGQCRRLLPGITDPSLDEPHRADLAHTLKGSALGVGAARVAELSAAIEDGLRRGGGVPAPAYAALTDAVEATLAEIDAPA
ncbi:Hpt domain-containing protein [Methylobacterium sp. W2]|uniref:Hpt domain-containing protein n=1 Tax=Methylobacterium sp. W2 TaxID=2598107 RepID=UPI001D0C2576|nr:Hpt domain-containing protein [Methylobacterium sp. W2]MCC0805823.1 Hpt domain-containing protein [Methylobacterium sp. W2]